MLLAIPILFGVLGGATDRIAVIEALTEGENAQPALGNQLAHAVDGLAPTEAVVVISPHLPAVTGAEKSEPVIEANALVEEGRGAYPDGRCPEAAQELA